MNSYFNTHTHKSPRGNEPDANGEKILISEHIIVVRTPASRLAMNKALANFKKDVFLKHTVSARIESRRFINI